jgi:hypothetical protein
MGPVTRLVQQAFHSAIRGQHPRSAEWLDYVHPVVPERLPVRESAKAISSYAD